MTRRRLLSVAKGAALLVAMIVTPSPAFSQEEDVGRNPESFDVQAYCPDTPQIDPNYQTDVLEPGFVEFLPQSLLTQRDYEVLRQRQAVRAAECRKRLWVEETQRFAVQIETLFNDLQSDNLAGNGLQNQSEHIGVTLDHLEKLVNYGTEPPEIELLPLPNERLSVRIQRLVNLSRRLIPNLLFMAGSEDYELTMLNQLRDDLTIAKAIASALPVP